MNVKWDDFEIALTSTSEKTYGYLVFMGLYLFYSLQKKSCAEEHRFFILKCFLTHYYHGTIVASPTTSVEVVDGFTKV